MTIDNIEFKLSEFSTKDLTQLANTIQKERQHRANIRHNERRNELCSKIIKDLEIFQREFSYETIVIYCPECDEEITIDPEEIISQIKNNWMV